MTGFLQGPDGNSSARLMSLISLLAAVGLGASIATGKASPSSDTLVYAFLSAAMGGNLANKAIESKKSPD